MRRPVLRTYLLKARSSEHAFLSACCISSTYSLNLSFFVSSSAKQSDLDWDDAICAFDRGKGFCLHHTKGAVTVSPYFAVNVSDDSPNGKEHDVQSHMFRATITDMQDLYCGNCYDIYLTQSRYTKVAAFGATTKEVTRPLAAPPHLWFPLYWLWIR